MLLFIELIFLVAGVWAVISGKLPSGLFRFLFGKGEYELPPNKTRLFALLLISPLPVSYLVSSLLTAIMGEKATGYAFLFEIIYILVVTISSIFIARKMRRPEAMRVDNPPVVSTSSEQKTSNYVRKQLIVIGIVFLGFMTVVSGFALIIVAISSITVGTRWTGDFWQDVFPLLLTIVIMGSGIFGVIKLGKLLRRQTRL